MDKQDYVIRYASKAREFAFLTYKEPRKYTGEPYIHHPAEMVGMFYSLMSGILTAQDMDTYCSIIWLHDVIEDCGVTKEQLIERFNLSIANGVQWLTDNEVGNRATRKRLARERLSKAPSAIQTIKCLDLWSNSTTIFIHDEKFAVTYAQEAQLYLNEALNMADYRARELVLHQLVDYRTKRYESERPL